MKLGALLLVPLLFLGGCATQQPVEIVEKGCIEEACRNELAALKKQCDAQALACNAARRDAEDRLQDKAAAIGLLEQRLQDQQKRADQAERALAEKSGDLDRCRSDLSELIRQMERRLLGEQKRTEQAQTELSACRSDLAALQQQAVEEAKACEAARQELGSYKSDAKAVSERMKALESSLRQRLQDEIGAKNVEIEQLRDQLSVRVLDRILFRSGSAEILPRGRAVLESVAAAIFGGNETVRIEGHTDNVPIGPNLKDKYFSNWELSTGRASSVARYFEGEGIEPTRMEAVGFSMYRSVAPNDSADNRQRNRRVEIVLTPWKPVVRECAE